MLGNIKDTKSNIPLYIAMLIPLLSGLGTGVANLVSMAELLIALYYFYSRKFWLLSPIFYIYYSQLLLIGESLALYTVYALVCICRAFLVDRSSDLKKYTDVNIMFILIIFSGLVLMAWTGIWAGAVLIVQSLALLYSAVSIRNDSEVRAYFKNVLVFMCLSGALYGILFTNIKGNYEEQETLIEYGGRYAGTSGDPNYMAFYYCIAFCFMLFSRNVNQWIKRIVLFLLFLMTALTGSLTALVVIAVTLILYIFIAKEKSNTSKLFNIALIVAAAIFFVVFVMNDDMDVPILELYRERIHERLDLFLKGNISGATAGRTEYSARYFSYLFDQNIFRILFGGYQLNSQGLLGEAANEIRFAAHNSYIDVVMTCGIVGLALFGFIIIYRIIKSFNHWRKTKDSDDIMDMMCTVATALFSAGLSVFPSTAYMLFFII